MRLKQIDKILKMNQIQLLNYTSNILKTYKFKKIIKNKQYVYAVGNIPILLVAHLDTVHKEQPKTILFDYKQFSMWSPEGIGGDDRCGIIAILDILSKGYIPHILFTTDEEIGCVGADAFCNKENLEKVKFAIEIDRRGNNQAVFYDCGNKDFQNYIIDKFDFDLQYGSFTDVCKIGETFDIAIVNLSAGYYNEHTTNEYIMFRELQNTINKVIKILEDNDERYFDYQQQIYTYYYSNGYYTPKSEKKYTFLEEKDWEELDDKKWFAYYGYQKPKTKAELFEMIINWYEDDY